MSEERVQEEIIDTVKNGERVGVPPVDPENPYGKGSCYFKSIVMEDGKTQFVKVLTGNNGYIVTAHPVDTKSCTGG